jgi:hypothetical protein
MSGGVNLFSEQFTTLAVMARKKQKVKSHPARRAR